MTDDRIIHDRIMRRVRRVHMLSYVAHPAALKIYAGLILGMLAASLVSFGNVVANMPSILDVTSLVYFLGSAILNTEMSVKGIALGIALLVFLALRDIAKLARTGFHIRTA